MKLIVSADTEGDDRWDQGCPLTTGNVRFWEPFRALCERHGLRPT